MATKRKIIQVPVEKFKMLQQKSGVSRSSVYYALNGNSNSAKAREIRRMAIEEFGGVERPKVIW